jgi:hypothetical protein
MAFCPWCGKPKDDTDKYCPWCGKSLDGQVPGAHPEELKTLEEPGPPAAGSKPRRSRKLLLVLAAALVLVAAVALVPRLRGGGDSTGGDPERQDTFAQELTAGLGEPFVIDDAALSTMFAVPAGRATPHELAPPPVLEEITLRALPAGAPPLANIADVRVEGDVPADFVAFVGQAVAGGAARFAEIYPDPAFNFLDAARARHFRVLITTDRRPFEAMTHVSVFRHGAANPCSNAPVSDRAECIPQVMINYEAAQWKSGEYLPMTQPRIAHEVFHVAHMYLLKALGKSELFQRPGYYWQTESFATFTQRLYPDPNAYLSFGANLLDEGYFGWPALTDSNYERAYEATFFADQAVFQTGDDPETMLRWVKEARPGESSSQSLMRTLAAGPTGGVDLNKFNVLYLRAITDLYFPGFIRRGVDYRTNAGLPYVGRTDATISWGSLPLKRDSTVPVLGNKQLRLQMGVMDRASDGDTLTFEVASGKSEALRTLLFAVKGDDSDNLTYCNQSISAEGKDRRTAETISCFRKHAMAFGLLGGGEDTATIEVGRLRRFSPNLNKLKVVALVFGLAGPSTAAAGSPPPPIPFSLTVKGSEDQTPSARPNIQLVVDYRGGRIGCGRVQGSAYDNHLRLDVDYQQGKVTGSCRLPYPNGGELTFDVDATVDTSGRIDGKIVNGVETSIQPGFPPNRLTFEGTFEGTVNEEGDGRGSGTYELTLADGKKLIRSDGTAVKYTESWSASPASGR